MRDMLWMILSRKVIYHPGPMTNLNRTTRKSTPYTGAKWKFQFHRTKSHWDVRRIIVLISMILTYLEKTLHFMSNSCESPTAKWNSSPMSARRLTAMSTLGLC